MSHPYRSPPPEERPRRLSIADLREAFESAMEILEQVADRARTRHLIRTIHKPWYRRLGARVAFWADRLIS